nr:hypothetical protein [Tanacetum cinerariifolium]
MKEKRELEDLLKENMKMHELFYKDEKLELFIKRFKEEFTTGLNTDKNLAATSGAGHGNDNDKEDDAGNGNDEDGAGHGNGGDVHGADHGNDKVGVDHGNGAGHRNDDGNSRYVDADTNTFAASESEKLAAEKNKEQVEKTATEKKKKEAEKISAAEKAKKKKPTRKLLNRKKLTDTVYYYVDTVNKDILSKKSELNDDMMDWIDSLFDIVADDVYTTFFYQPEHAKDIEAVVKQEDQHVAATTVVEPNQGWVFVVANVVNGMGNGHDDKDEEEDKEEDAKDEEEEDELWTPTTKSKGKSLLTPKIPQTTKKFVAKAVYQ